MKRSLIAAAILAFSTASHAAIQSMASEGPTLDRSLPTYPELGLDSWRNDAGETENGNTVRIQLGEGKYRLDAGQPTDGLLVQDSFSA